MYYYTTRSLCDSMQILKKKPANCGSTILLNDQANWLYNSLDVRHLSFNRKLLIQSII